MQQILIVDDDPDIRDLIAEFLARHDFHVATAADGPSMDRAIDQAQQAGQPFDLLVLDRMMPGEDGLTITRRLASARGPAIIILSAMGEDSQRIEGLDGGADDYLAKPVNPQELLARIRAVLRRRASATAPVAELGQWRLDLVRRELTAPGGVLVSLTDSEFAMLQLLADTPGKPVSREMLVARLHGGTRDTFDRAIDVQVSRLRKKLERVAGEAGLNLIRTVRNGGYSLATLSQQG